MPQIRPVSDLRNRFADISRTVHETQEAVILTRNGYGDMVVISYEAYEKLQHETNVFLKLKEAEMESNASTQRYAHADVMSGIREKLANVGKPNV